MRNIIAIILAVCAFAYSHVALSGYAQLKPPPGWSQGLGAAVPGQAGVFAFGAAANAASFKGSTVLTNAALNVAGQLVTIPVSMRVAANAATVAAEWSFGNPYLFAAALAAPVAYAWFKQSGFEVKNGVWSKKLDELSCANGVCYEYRLNDASSWGDISSACNAGISGLNAAGAGVNVYALTGTNINGSCIATRTYTWANPPSVSANDFTVQRRALPPSVGEKWVPVELPEFKEKMAPLPLPDAVPEELPAVPWPVQPPVFNPDPAIDPLPAPSPAQSPRPLWVPTGDPVKNPNSNPATNPDTWTQPGVRVTPSPTASDPWRVDVTPEPITKPDPSPNVDEVPDDTSTTPEAEPSKPLCELYPDIVACAKLGTPPAVTPVPNVNKPVTITKDSGWGPENGSCPSPRVLNLHGLTVNMSWDLYCQFAIGIRPIVLGLAYLGAVFTFFGIGRKT